MRFVMLFVIVTGVLSACKGSADKKVPQLADEMCGCFDSFNKELSAESRALMKEVSEAGDPQMVLLKGISKLKKEDAAVLAGQLRSIGEKGSAVYTCMENFDKLHSKETTTDRKKLTESLLEEMKAEGNCPVGAAIVSLSLKQGIK